MEKMENKIKKTLKELREYGLSKEARFSLLWHYENSHFIRYANSGISLNTSENLNRLYITVYGSYRQVTTNIILDPSDQVKMRDMFDEALEMLKFSGELSYQPTLVDFEGYSDKRCYDEDLAKMDSDAMIDFVKKATFCLETDDVVLSGNFNKGETVLCTITSLSDDIGYWAATDAQVTLVMSSRKKKCEVSAEQSAYRKKTLSPAPCIRSLAFWSTPICATSLYSYLLILIGLSWAPPPRLNIWILSAGWALMVTLLCVR